ncbi:FG-GAP-like repeat-containing protein [Chryseobacterium sp. PTM-20240506]|uniref:FG-GAP-like repeat-containing protein n=1 Tax=unclassified Chryseobacterium TaxID=2593645 RepID=UPI002358A414|nr:MULTISPECIES: FG-GAP-like repeat-containing protein [unclassified Chryseobacterium]MDC8105710.1 FG-GAP-like repeat-containing protein [Chryseobacterium sp. B21-037]MDQ1804214.1 FG-GAP-like repeat-containing protein [Chryseobacterium sp. CKR4-1]
MRKNLSLFILLFNITWGIAQLTCASALNVVLGTNTAPVITGTAATTACNIGLPGTAGLWYKYTATQDRSVTVSTVITGQNVDTREIIFKGTCGALTCVTANDDFLGNASQVTFTAQAGTTYYIVFDNKWSSSGFNFTVSETAPLVNRVSFTPQSGNVYGTYNNCVVDMNGDYLDDIVSVLSNTQIAISYQQPGGTFNPVTYNVPNTTVTPSWSIAAGDYDNNGFNDLIYGSGNGICFLKANADGTGYTSDRKPQTFLTQRTNFIDINKDGKLDAFVCDDNAPNRFYLNDGTNMNHNQGGLGDFPSGGNYGSIWIDYDNDGDMDLYIAKCSGGGSGPGGNVDELHRNNGDGTFTNVAVAANMANPTQTWSSAWGDFNNDGWMDAIIGINSTSNGLSRVMKNNGNGTFTDVSVGSGYDIISNLSREYVAYDFDNDGFLDVLGAGNTIMFGNGNFQFTPNLNPYSLDFNKRPIGDLNNDGFLDIQSGQTIMINDGNSNHWLKVTLRGTQSNRNGIGARVEIYGEWGKQIRDVQSGVGFMNMNTLNVHFGIGQATTIGKVVVKWPSGLVDVISNVTPDTTLHVVEGTHLDVKEVQNTQELLTVYPNPSADLLNFKSNADFVPVEARLFDASGRIALQTKVERNTISIKQLNTGTYILVLLDKNGKLYSQKVTKK